MATHLFVYYKLEPGNAVRALLLAQQVLNAGKPFARAVQLMRRPYMDDESPQTWMEMYLDVHDLVALQSAIQASAQDSGLTALLIGSSQQQTPANNMLKSPRHHEVFEDF